MQLQCGDILCTSAYFSNNKILITIVSLSESPYFGQKQPDDQGSHVRRASEKVKKRMKMADLKAFVETKLLSISEKTLEKIGRDEPKVFYGQVLSNISFVLRIAWNVFIYNSLLISQTIQHVNAVYFVAENFSIEVLSCGVHLQILCRDFYCYTMVCSGSK